MTDTNDCLVVLPAHDEEEAIGGVLTRIKHHLPKAKIVVVDSASTDNTAEIAKPFAEVVKLSENRGAGAAAKHGLEYFLEKSDAPFLIKMDADGQHDPRYLQEVHRLLRRSVDFVSCSRFHPSSPQMGTPSDRVSLNKIASDIVAELTGLLVTDARSGFVGLHRRVVEAITPRLIVERYGYPMEYLLRAWHMFPDLFFCEIAHPAIYNVETKKLKTKYRIETTQNKIGRIEEAISALQLVLKDMDVK